MSHTNICSPEYRTECQAGGPGFGPGFQGSKGLRLAVRPPPKAGAPTVPPRSGLAVLVLVRHSAGFAALFLGGAAWGHDAQDSHCLQAQGEAFAAVG